MAKRKKPNIRFFEKKKKINIRFFAVILFDMYEPMIGPDSIQFCNSDELALRHGAYGRCFSDSANAKYYKMVDQVRARLQS